VAESVEHPFLICRRRDYGRLCEQATREPWRDFTDEARRVLEATREGEGTSSSRGGTRIRDVMGSAALLYVIDPDRRDAYLGRIRGVLDAWPEFLKAVDERWNAGGNRWFATVPPSSGYFNSVLALDVVHDDLADADLCRYEQSLEATANWFWARMRGWGMATFGPRAIWAAYRGEDRLPEAMAQYRDAVFQQMTEDGVGRNGPEYSHARLNGERTAKYGFMHVAEYTGLDRVYYGSPVLQKYYEWLFSAGCSPFHTFVTFGDSGHGRSFDTFYPESGSWAAGRFSDLAAAYASRRVTSSEPRFPSDLLAYCIAQPLPQGKTPGSRIWTNGGALFYEENDTQDALMGAIWNVDRPSHDHCDANAVYLAGYGEHLLLNSGYNGYGNDAEGSTWGYIHDTAESSNTLMLGGENHTSKGGDGIAEGLLGHRLGYACGRSERALPGEATHERSLVFVHPGDGASGYSVLFDEVQTCGLDVSLALHPASREVVTDTPGCQYTWNVRKRKPSDTFLTVFLATSPDDVVLREGVLAGWRESFVGTYLYATYGGQEGARQIVTVLFPSDEAHSAGSISRISGQGFTGARVGHGDGIVDCCVASTGMEATCEGVSLQGHAAAWRQTAGAGVFYFVRREKQFRNASGVGFNSEESVSVYMRGSDGKVVSRGTAVTFHRPGVCQVYVDGAAAEPEAGGSGWVRVRIPPGTHDVNLS